MISYKKIAILIAAAMIFTSNGQAYAADLNVSQEQISTETSVANENNSQEIVSVEDVSESEGDSENSNNQDAAEEETTESTTGEVTNEGATGETPQTDENEEETSTAGSGEETPADGTEGSEEERSTAVVTTENGIMTISDTIKADETSYIVNEIFSVEPGQMIQANLTVPQDENLNYDLYLYNIETDSMVDSCAYPTYSNTGSYLDETVEYVNTTSEAQSYCFLINAPNGGNDTKTFTLKVGTFDTPENYTKNHNAFNATQINGPLTSSNSIGNTMNSPLDNDWYVMPVDSNYSKSTIAIAASGDVNLDVYVHLGNGCFFKLTPTSSGNYAAYAGYYYYIKVSDKNGSGSYPKNYTLQTNYLANSITISGYNNVEYRDLFQMNQCWTDRNLTVKGTVKASDGTKLANKYVCVTFQDPLFAKRQNNPNEGTARAYGYTDVNGNYEITVRIPTLFSGEAMISTGYSPYSDPKYGDIALIQAEVLDGSGAFATDTLIVQTY